MKSMYYQANKVSLRSLAIMATVTILMVGIVEAWPFSVDTSSELAMQLAIAKTQQAYNVIRDQRRALGHRFLRDHDPAQTGMIGPSMSRVTSLPGHLDAKQSSVNPQFAAVAMRLLLDAGVKPGDRVAVGCTGSFPAMNIAVYSAIETLGLRPSVVSSVASSQFGANHPNMTWPDMERLLNEEHVFTTRSLAASRGGFRDNAIGMTDDTRALLDAAIARSELKPMHCDSIGESIDARMNLYRDNAAGEKFAAYINIGGGSASVGGSKGNQALGSGLLKPQQAISEASWLGLLMPQPTTPAIDCVAQRFLADEVPIVNLIDIVALAKRYGLAVGPNDLEHGNLSSVPATLYTTSAYRRPAAIFAILVILACVTALAKPPRWWTKFCQRLPQPFGSATEPTLMV